MANYSIDRQSYISKDDTTNKAIVRVEMWAAATANVPAYNSLPDVILAPGSIAMIPSEGKALILDFDNTWKEWGGKLMDAVDVFMAGAILNPRISALESEMASITNPMLVKGTVDTVEDLEDIQNPEPGWVYLVGLEADPNKKEYVYTTEGTWDFLGYQMPIDANMSTTSENAVQNKVVTVAINGKAALTLIAAEFDSTVTYSAGKIVLKDSALYVYTAIAPSSGAWDASKWSVATLGALIEAKQNLLTFDTTPTQGSSNPVSSGGVYTALADKSGV